MTGTGVVVVSVDPSSGVVKAAQMQPSIGHKVLDDAALATFRQWRFRPGTVSKVRIPIGYTLGRFHVYVRALGDWSWSQNVTYWFLPVEAINGGVTGRCVVMLKIAADRF
jgi:TonB family protein